MMPLYPSDSVVNTTIINDLPQVTGSHGAKTYPTRPNTRDAVWDKDENYIYIRQTDSTNNITSIMRLSYEEAPEPKPEDIFAKRDDITELKGEINDVKQYIQELTATIAASNQSNGGVNGSNAATNGNGKSGKNQRSNGNNPVG